MKRLIVTTCSVIFFLVPLYKVSAQAAAPEVSSFDPVAARPGTSVIITGLNFSSTPSNNVVSFGGVRASVNTASVGTLSVTVPGGASYGPIKVTTVPKNGFSELPFIPTFAGGDLEVTSFAPRINMTHETKVRGFNVGDIDGDGKPDLVVGNYDGIGNFSDYYISVYPNTSSGSTISFGSVVHIPSLAGITEVYLDDMNGDGKLDVVTVNGLEAAYAISVFPNTSTPGNFSFGTRTDFNTNFTINTITFQVRKLAIGDIDGDGYLDMGVLYNLQYFRIIKNSSSGTWSTPFQESDIGEPRGIVFADFNYDGTPDIAIANALSDTAWRMYTNNSIPGTISLSKTINFPSGGGSGNVYKGDFDNDGRIDLLVGDANIYLHSRAYSSSAFDPVVTITAGQADNIGLGDVDGDGKVDIVAQHSGNNVRVFRNQSTSGSFSFAGGIDYASGGGIRKLKVADLNADGKPEIILNHITEEDNTISILQNTILPYSLSQTTVNTSSGTVESGSTVNITLQLRDNNGVLTGVGGPTVVFSLSGGGTSTGAFSAVTPNGSGTYTATLTGIAAGTARTISATIDGRAITSTLPTLTVIPGPPSLSQSVVTVETPVIVKNQSTLVTLAMKDTNGNLLTTGGHSVLFGLGTGTSAGIFGTVTDLNNGSYTATFTGTVVGSATQITASINGSSVTSTPPTITVESNDPSSAQSIVSISPQTFQSGTTSTVTLQAKNINGTNLAAGGTTVTFSLTGGGQSAGTFGSVVDHNDGIYTTVITGTTAGSARQIRATINGDTVTSPPPPFTVTPGPFSLVGSTLTVSPNPVPSGTSSVITFQSRDAAGNAIAQTDLTLTFSLRAAPVGGGGTSTGQIGSVVNHGDGSYTATLKGLVAGTACTLDGFVTGIIGGGNKQNGLPLVTVVPGAASLSQSVLTISAPMLPVTLSTTITLQAKDSVGNFHTQGGLNISFALSGGGTSDGTIGTVTDHNNGTYTAAFTGTTVGTVRTVTAFVNGNELSATLPTITVTVGPPVITSFTPESDSAGSSIQITGSNFSSTPAEDVVFLGSTPAQVTSASPTSLTVVVPPGAGYGQVTVVNLSSGLSVVSATPFQKKFKAGGYLDQTALSTRLDVTSGSPVSSIATGDLDGDGAADVVASNKNASSLSVYRNTGTPGSLSFAPPLPLWGGGNSESVDLADIDGDGKLDIVVQNPGNAFSIAVLRNTSSVGAISFAAAQNFSTVSGTVDGVNSLAIADFNRDGRIDVATIYDDASVSGTDHKAIVLLNISVPGSVSFAQPYNIPLAYAPKGVGGGDLDGDGRAELIVSHGNATKLSIFRNTTVAGVLSFAGSQEFSTASLPYGIAVNDVNGDNKADVLVANRSGSVSVFKNTSVLGTVSLDTKQDFTAQFGSSSVAVGDLDGDGIPDLMISNDNSGSISLLKNTTSSGVVLFAAPQHFSIGNPSAKGSLADLDKDGKPDIAVATSTLNSFSAFRNTVGPYSPQQSIVTVSVDSVLSGSTVTVTLQLKNLDGTNLNLAGQTVLFSLSGAGTSNGTFGSVTDHGDGTYSANFTGGLGGTPKAIGASINSTPVTSTLPTVKVFAGAYSVNNSFLTAPVNPPSINIVSSGNSFTLILHAKDAIGNNHTIGGLNVAFFRSGNGTSTGTFGPTIDSGNGLYSALFTGVIAGTTDSIGATIDGDTIKTTRIRFNVQPGSASAAASIITVSPSSVQSGIPAAGTFYLSVRDGNGNIVTASDPFPQIQFFLMGGGTSNGLINHPNGGWADIAGPGSYYATFTGTESGTPSPVGAVLNGVNVSTTSPTITVTPGQISRSNSYVELPLSSMGIGFTMTAVLHAYDVNNNPHTSGTLNVTWDVSGGAAGGTFGPVTYVGNGNYTVQFTAVGTGQRYVVANINGQGLTSTPQSVQVINAFPAPAIAASGGGSALEINGAGYVNIPDAPALRLTDNFTLEAWILPWGNQNLTILDKGNYNYLFSFRPNGTTGLGLFTIQTGWIYSGGTVPKDQWSHVAVVYHSDTNGVKFYLNGTLLGAATPSASIVSNTGPVNIGRQNPGNCNCNIFQGQLDEVRIWNVARTQAEIQSGSIKSLGATAGLLASYNMNEGSGGTISDASGNGNTGTLTDLSWASSGLTLQTIQPTALTLQWSAVDGAEAYRLQVATDFAFTSIAMDTSVGTNSFALSGLPLSTTYYWRVKATASYNASPYSSVASFVTTSVPPGPPTVATSVATAMMMTSAQLNAVVSANGAFTTARFLYGTSSGIYTDSVAATQSPLGALDSVGVSATLSGLAPSQTYYFRATGSSSYGYQQGNEVSFTTKAPPVLSQVAGSALLFDGANDYVSTTITDLSGSEITIEYWFKGTSATSAVRQQSGGDYIVAPWSSPPIHILSNDGGTGAGLSAGSAIYDGSWHHVAMTWKQNTTDGFKSYLDGNIVAQRNSGNTPIPNINTNVFIGSYVGAGEFTAGTMDEVRIWKVARSAQQIREHMHRPVAATDTGLVSYWQMIEGTGNVVSDSIGNHDGTLVNGTTWTSSTVPFGGGTSISASGITSESTTLGNVSIVLSDPFDGPVDLTVTEVKAAPNTTAGTTGNLAANHYWIIEAFGTPGSFLVGLTLKVPPGSISEPDIETPSNLKLYRRNSTADEAWTEIATGTSATDSSVTFSGISSFSQFTIGSMTSPLPVELVSFTATSTRLNAELKWNTATEVNNKGFTIERKAIQGIGRKPEASNPKSESSPWISVGHVEGAGTSNKPNEYSFTDRNVKAGNYAYRLKQIDRDGRFKYSSNVEVAVGSVPKIFALEQNYPNPFNPTTTIGFSLEVSGLTTLKVYDVIGREVATLVNENLEAGVYHQTTFDGSNLSSGVYFAGLVSNGKRTIKKLMLLK